MRFHAAAWLPAVAIVASACAHTEPEHPSETPSADIWTWDTTKLFRGNPDDATSKESEYLGSATPLKDADLASLWEASETVLRMEGYVIDTGRTSYDKREMYTHWDTYLAPVRFEGKRHRAIVKFAQAPEGGWLVKVVDQLQRNVDIDNPSNPAQANWEDMAPPPTRSQVILYKIESGFRDPSDDDGKETR